MNPVDEIFKKYHVEPMRYYPVKKLYDIMYELGLVRMTRNSFTRDWMSRKVKSGVIVLPEKKPGYHWQLTGEQIKGIVYAFAPGGKQEYDYTKNET